MTPEKRKKDMKYSVTMWEVEILQHLILEYIYSKQKSQCLRSKENT